jgi:hypothetical protein
MGKQKGKTQARKELPLTPRPRGGIPWDWTKCYCKAGDRVTVFSPKGVNGPEPGATGTVEGTKKNRFGRVDYLVRLDGKRKAEAFSLEELLDNPFWEGPGTTLLHTGRAAVRLRKAQEKQ